MTQFAPQHSQAGDLFKSERLRDVVRSLDFSRPVDAVFKISLWPSLGEPLKTWIAQASEFSKFRPGKKPFRAVSRFEILNQDVVSWAELPADVQVSQLAALPPKPRWWSN